MQGVARSPADKKNSVCNVGEYSAHSTTGAASSGVVGMDTRGGIASKRRREEEAEDSDADHSDGDLQVRKMWMTSVMFILGSVVA